jgi:hypothetical protein
MPRSIIKTTDGFYFLDEREPRDVVEVQEKMRADGRYLRIKPSPDKADGFEYVNPDHIICVVSYNRGPNIISSSVPKVEGTDD